MHKRYTVLIIFVFIGILTACSESDENDTSSEDLQEAVEIDDDKNDLVNEGNIDEELKEEDTAQENESDNKFTVPNVSAPNVSAPDVSPPEHIEPPNVSAPEVSISLEDDHVKLEVPDHLLFDFDESTLREDAKDLLTELRDELLEYTYAQIEIHGHTDNEGNPAYNKTLSEERAKAVESFFLEEQSLRQFDFMTKGYGETEPIVSNDTEENRAKNRRVEIFIFPYEED